MPLFFSRASAWFSFLITMVCAVCPALPGSAQAETIVTAHETRGALPAPILYTLDIPEAGASNLPILHVTLTLETSSTIPLDFAIPAWTPGYYQILRYEENIRSVRALAENGQALTVTHPSSRIWHLEPLPPSTNRLRRLKVSYDVVAQEEGLGFFGSALDRKNHRAYVNGASAFLYLAGNAEAACRLAVHAPPGWKIACPLPAVAVSALPVPAANAPFTEYTANSYDTLIDSPLQMGEFETVSFRSANIPVSCVIVGRASLSRARLTDALQRITRAAIELFGTGPFDSYMFLYHVGGGGFDGGLEHGNSTVIHLPARLADANEADFLSTTAHEFFHAWNVKRLHPAGLGPFDYTQPVRTASLWWAEGVTDYYAQWLLVRSGLRSRDWFLHDMADRMAALDATPARRRVSLEEASRKSWEGGSEGYGGLSYYLKGSLVAFYFDLRLRELTRGERGLDSVMRLLYQRYGVPGNGYPEPALLAAVNEIAGQDMEPEYARYVRGTEEIDWQAALGGAGLRLKREARGFLGVHLANTGGKVVIVDNVETGFAGAQAGLLPGDCIAAIDNQPVNTDTFGDIVHALIPETPLQISVLRQNQPLLLTGTAGSVYQNHVLVAAPLGEVSISERIRQKSLLNRLFEGDAPLVPASEKVSASTTTPSDHTPALPQRNAALRGARP